MENEESFFSIPRYINGGRIVMGFPADEIIPALLTFALLGFNNHILPGLITGAVVFTFIRYFKQTKGNNFFKLTLYWYSPQSLKRAVFKKTPAPSEIYWLN